MSYLDELLRSTRTRVAEAKRMGTAGALERRVAARLPPRAFGAALRGGDVAVIAEIKRLSPARGPLAPDLDAAAAANAYARGGAAAVSVLTEPDHFGGRNEDVEAAAGAGLPVLRKDFLLDEWQVLESRAIGADAVLVIARVLDDHGLDLVVKAAEALGMDALVEVHDAEELDRALGAGARLIGVNHRDLATFEVDEHLTAALAPLVPEGCVLVALSGVSRRDEVQRLARAGAAAVLVGESVIAAPDPAAKIRSLRGLL